MKVSEIILEAEQQGFYAVGDSHAAGGALSNASGWINKAKVGAKSTDSIVRAGLQGNPVDNALPTTNDVLAWDGGKWTPTDPSSVVNNADAIYGSFSDSL